MGLKQTKTGNHGSLGVMPRKGPLGAPHVSMGKNVIAPDKTFGGNIRVHGGVAGGPSPIKTPKVISHATRDGKPISKWGRR